MTDPKTIAIAVVGGLVPALIWLWFWLREDKEKPEPKGLLALTFIGGMAAVIFVLPLEKFANTHIANQTTLLVVWSALEEIAKFAIVALIALKTPFANEPIDYPIYFITTALGFAALENTLFLLHPLSIGDGVVGLITGNLRFLGATLLHSAASALIGISMGLAFYKPRLAKKFYTVIGLLAAIALHGVFNFFIMRESGGSTISMFGFLWVVIIIIMLLFEKIRRISNIN
ncbi:hypothetical protein A3B93_02385 [Candidatus Nomurabacteria bacterium RIFCSPHIGHO2_02_FULL_42_24]|uniref:Protease PrsW n=1 Tax=Candidatus Nomurabacteria bacterium RIFCSPHIGHO2_02_FULL_42_24 TaxID=1801757 RepID=A0A1F6WJK1_9BACT|nr:MAG: hypothetical protein A3B93_02385 [Candidatus Nomurabacteria bacterium RIFCSPHIGHO2_02_FULL_42_24]